MENSMTALTGTLVDINELSRRLSVPKGTLYNWVYLRRIHSSKPAGPFDLTHRR
jgi:hypothetical protein